MRSQLFHLQSPELNLDADHFQKESHKNSSTNEAEATIVVEFVEI